MTQLPLKRPKRRDTPSRARLGWAWIVPLCSALAVILLAAGVAPRTDGDAVAASRSVGTQTVTRPVNDALFSPDGKLVVTARYTTATIWAVDTGRRVHTFPGHTDLVIRAAFSPDGKLVVTASADGMTRIWDAGAGRSVHTLWGHSGPVVAARLRPDGKLVVTAYDNGDAEIWDVATGRSRHRLVYAGPVAAFSPDGKRVVTAGGGTAQIWDVASGHGLHTLR
jgi:WD40 repeat protein